MDLTLEVSETMLEARIFVETCEFEYITPEIILLMMCNQKSFEEAFKNCDGDIEELRENLHKFTENHLESIQVKEPELSEGSAFVLAFAGQSARNSAVGEIKLSHMLHGIWQLENSYAVYYMKKQGIDEAKLLRELTICEEAEAAENLLFDVMDDDEYFDDDMEEGMSFDRLKSFAPCLNETLTDANPLIGREDELERTIQILCRKDKNNPLHIGEPGVGKTAITYGLVQRIKEGEVPKAIEGCKVFSLDLGGILAGTQYRGDFEKRFQKILQEIAKEEKPIIYIDEIHNLSGAGAVGESSFDAANMLKPYLSGGHIRFIGATTFEEYKKYFEKNKSLARRFQNVEIQEPGEEETVEILKGLKDRYEEFHGVVYEEGVLDYAVTMSAKHIHERFLPDKAIDLIDEAGAYRKLHPTSSEIQTVDKEVVSDVLTKICRVPSETVQTDEVAGLATLEERLKKRVFCQDEAIAQVVNAVKFSRAGLLEEGKPLASLLFVGPTGVGKTEIAKSLAEEMGVKLIRFDMSEYAEKHAVAKLIGSPAGYVGYEEGGLLTEEIRKNPFSVLLLDEIEKAHPDIYHILLQVMDYATLTDNQGRKADFRNVILIMTSNAGASRIGKQGIGFQSTSQDSGVIMEEVKHAFQPEFRNRLNRIVVFHGMDVKMAESVIEKKLGELAGMLEKRDIRLSVDERAKSLLRKKGISEEFGAREIDRIIRNEIKPLIVDDILFGNLKGGGKLKIFEEKNSFAVSVQK